VRRRNFSLLDVQWVNPHLKQFGAMEIPRGEYLQRLKRAVGKESVFV
jgi:leucyl/phenylalanyl-tRNA--protein transferase